MYVRLAGLWNITIDSLLRFCKACSDRVDFGCDESACFASILQLNNMGLHMKQFTSLFYI